MPGGVNVRTGSRRTDGSDTADRAVDAAARLAAASDATLTVAHAYPVRTSPTQRSGWHDVPAEFRWRLSPGTVAEATVDAAVDRARAAAGDDLEVSGWSQPVAVLLDVVERIDADVLVIGNRDMGHRFRTRPSVGRAVARRVTCDVVIVDTLGLRERRRGARPPRPLPSLVEPRPARAR